MVENGRSERDRGQLACILWHLFKYREAFNPEVFPKEEEKMQRKKLARLHNTAAALGLKLLPRPMTYTISLSGGSCRRHGINPFEYLKDLFTRLASAKTTQIKKFTPAA